MESFLLEKRTLKLTTVPVDLSTAANTGARVAMKNVHRVTFVAMLAAGTARTASFALKQHNAAASGTTKALSVANMYFKKAGTETKFTKVEPTVAADTYDLSADYVTNGGMVVFEVLAEDLDTNGGFTHVSLDMADAGASASLGAVLALIDYSKLPAYDLDV